MKSSVLLAVISAIFLTLLALPANAQATRTWISGVGDDANPCSRTAPCKTFAGAISKTSTGGEIDCLDPGGFGALTITKAITLDCASGEGGQVGSVLVSGTNGLNISSGLPAGNSVTIRNMSISGQGTGLIGISWLAGAGALHVENVEITGFSTAGISFTNTAAANLFVRDSQISDTTQTTGGAILVKPSGAVLANVSLYRVRMDRNLFGLRVEDGAKATVQDSVAHANNGNGFLAVSASAASEINLIRSVASNTVTNGVATSGANAVINMFGSAVTDNGTGINTSGGGTIAGTSPATNLNSGNATPGSTNATNTLQ